MQPFFNTDDFSCMERYVFPVWLYVYVCGECIKLFRSSYPVMKDVICVLCRHSSKHKKHSSSSNHKDSHKSSSKSSDKHRYALMSVLSHCSTCFMAFLIWVQPDCCKIQEGQIFFIFLLLLHHHHHVDVPFHSFYL